MTERAGATALYARQLWRLERILESPLRFVERRHEHVTIHNDSLYTVAASVQLLVPNIASDADDAVIPLPEHRSASRQQTVTRRRAELRSSRQGRRGQFPPSTVAESHQYDSRWAIVPVGLFPRRSYPDFKAFGPDGARLAVLSDQQRARAIATLVVSSTLHAVGALDEATGVSDRHVYHLYSFLVRRVSEILETTGSREATRARADRLYAELRRRLVTDAYEFRNRPVTPIRLLLYKLSSPDSELRSRLEPLLQTLPLLVWVRAPLDLPVVLRLEYTERLRAEDSISTRSLAKVGAGGGSELPSLPRAAARLRRLHLQAQGNSNGGFAALRERILTATLTAVRRVATWIGIDSLSVARECQNGVNARSFYYTVSASKNCEVNRLYWAHDEDLVPSHASESSVSPTIMFRPSIGGQPAPLTQSQDAPLWAIADVQIASQGDTRVALGLTCLIAMVSLFVLHHGAHYASPIDGGGFSGFLQLLPAVPAVLISILSTREDGLASFMFRGVRGIAVCVSVLGVALATTLVLREGFDNLEQALALLAFGASTFLALVLALVSWGPRYRVGSSSRIHRRVIAAVGSCGSSARKAKVLGMPPSVRRYSQAVFGMLGLGFVTGQTYLLTRLAWRFRSPEDVLNSPRPAADVAASDFRSLASPPSSAHGVLRWALAAPAILVVAYVAAMAVLWTLPCGPDKESSQ